MNTISHEIERKFLVDGNKVNEYLKANKDNIVEKKDSTLYYISDTPTTRIGKVRNITNDTEKYLLWIKGERRNKYDRLEFVTEINEELFKEMKKNAKSIALSKERYRLSDGLEIDRYKGVNLGLWVAEMEFDSIDEANKYVPEYDFIIKDITNNNEYSNKTLSNFISVKKSMKIKTKELKDEIKELKEKLSLLSEVDKNKVVEVKPNIDNTQIVEKLNSIEEEIKEMKLYQVTIFEKILTKIKMLLTLNI